MLWIALHLPLLSLEAFAASLAADVAEAPLALIEAQQVVGANAAAQALGIKPGLKRATALALAPYLTLGAADPARDAQALRAVAHAALAYTPQVALAAEPATVLLEVEASLRCFGGRAQLLQRLQATLEPLGHRIHRVLAPTAQAAALLAHLHRRLDCRDLLATERALDAAPAWLLEPRHRQVLQGMGLINIGDLRALPRAGLARRFGPSLLETLDRALGRRPDPREPLNLPPFFASRLELHARADTSEQLLHGAGVLLARLGVWLEAQQTCVRRYTLALQHETRRSAGPAETVLEVALAEPSRDLEHLRLLLRERLAQLQLPAPTLELRLHAHDLVQRAAPNRELFPTPQSDREGLTRLIERLQARLGDAQVQRLLAVPDHRPEHASRLQPAAATPAHRSAVARPAAPRPVWLLDTPQSLPERQTRPLLEGRPLQLLSGPERIESGWWDAQLAERDYFIAQAADGALVWIYRARLPLSSAAPGWFMQGRFG